jgi:hypothetical protein
VTSPPRSRGDESDEFARWAEHYLGAKSRHDVPELVACFAPDCGYEDAVLSRCSTRAQLRLGLQQVLAQLPEGAGSSLVWAAGADSGGAVRFDNDAALFGAAMPVLAVVELEDGLVVRQRDYWDGRVLGRGRLADLRRRFPPHAPARPVAAARSHPRAGQLAALAEALWPLAVEALHPMLAPEVVLRDLTTGLQLAGRDPVLARLRATWGTVPYGAGASASAVVGGDGGGAVEWRARADITVGGGAVGVRIVAGAITELVWCWDASRVRPTRVADIDAQLLRDAQ